MLVRVAIVFISNPDGHGFIPAVLDVVDTPREIAARCESHRMVCVKLRDDGAQRWVNREWIALIEPDPALEQPDQQQDDDDQKDDSAADIHGLGVPLNRRGLT
jgi:hypothetical protein